MGAEPPAEGIICVGLHRAYEGEGGSPGVLDKQGLGAPSLGGCKVRKCFFAVCHLEPKRSNTLKLPNASLTSLLFSLQPSSFIHSLTHLLHHFKCLWGPSPVQVSGIQQWRKQTKSVLSCEMKCPRPLWILPLLRLSSSPRSFSFSPSVPGF